MHKGFLESFTAKTRMTSALPTAKKKRCFSLLNDRSRDSGVKNESLLPTKSKGCFRLSDGRLAILVNGGYGSDPELQTEAPVLRF